MSDFVSSNCVDNSFETNSITSCSVSSNLVDNSFETNLNTLCSVSSNLVEKDSALILCKHWERKGKCLLFEQSLCRFGHPEDARGSMDGNTRQRATRGFSKAKNGDKAGVFRRWYVLFEVY
jgi:hypothetical protein